MTAPAITSVAAAVPATAPVAPKLLSIVAPLLEAAAQQSENAHVLLTMQSVAEMSLFDWRRHVEELRHTVAEHLPVDDWPSLVCYGPGNGDFDDGCVAIMMRTSRAVVDAILRDIGENYWLSLSVTVFAIGNYSD